MSRPSGAWALPLDERPPAFQPERPPAFQPEQIPHGDVGDGHHETGAALAPASSRGGPSVAAIGSHVRLLGREYLELAASYAALSENVSTVVMRVPLASFIMQIDALKAAALDLHRSIGKAWR